MYEIIMEQEAWYRFWNYVRLCPDEVAAFGYCVPGEEYLYVDELFIVPQTVSGTEVDFTTDGLPYAIEKATQDERIQDLRFCIHSHVNMGTGFSAMDDDMIEKIGITGTPWFASAIFNKKGEVNARVDVFGIDSLPGSGQVTFKAGISRELLPNEELLASNCEDELAEYVNKKQYVNKQTANAGKRVVNGVVQEYPQHSNGAAPKALPAAKEWHAPEDGYMPNSDEELIAEAIKNGWDEHEDTYGVSYFFDGNGAYRGSIDATSPWSATAWDEWDEDAKGWGTP